MIKIPIQGIFHHNMLVIPAKCFFRNIDIVGSHGNQFLIIKRNPQHICQLYPQLASTASKFTAYCNYFIHNVHRPFSFVCACMDP